MCTTSVSKQYSLYATEPVITNYVCNCNDVKLVSNIQLICRTHDRGGSV